MQETLTRVAFPDNFLVSAVGMARRHGVYAIARALGLEYNRWRGVDRRRRSKIPTVQRSAKFMELTGALHSHYRSDRLPILSPGVRCESGKNRGEERRAAYEWKPAVKNVRFVGLDIHAQSIAVAVTKTGGEVERCAAWELFLTQCGVGQQSDQEAGQARAIAGGVTGAQSTGYVLYWQLTKLGVRCEEVAPKLIPVKSGGRVKTERRDAEKRPLLSAGDLTAV